MTPNQTIPNPSTEPTLIVAIGAGNRMRTYMHFVETHPDIVRLVAVVEPDPVRRNDMADRFGVPENMRFAHYRDFFATPVKADAVMICTPENEHYWPCMLALDAGYHILLEKPIAQTYDQCLQIARKARDKGKIVSICHVLRYHPLFIKIKELVDSGTYGRIISINHTEEVGIDRDTHSYVRGIMNREKESNPMLLAKCCHDLDFLLWICGAGCSRVSSFGSLLWFRGENAPEGSADRCVDCSIEHKCPYSAIDLYKRRREWISNFIPAPGQTVDDVIQQQLDNGIYGRCVYRCDNDVVDNQIVTMQMDNGMLISLAINVFTQRDCRNIAIKMTEGEITCNGSIVEARHFKSRQTTTFDFTYLKRIKFHGGADIELVADFINAVRNPGTRIQTEIDGALETHRIIFEAERSRHTGQTLSLTPICG